MTDFRTVPVKDIHPDPNQPRKFYDEVAMQELTESVKEKGILQPILIRPNGNGYILVCGERRYKASITAGLTEIPAVVRELSDDEALELQIIENLQRKDVHPMEEAVAFKSLIEKKQWTIQEVGQRVGKKEAYIRQRLKLSDLVPEWQKMFYKDAFNLHDALQLCILPEKQQKEFYKSEIDADDEKNDHPKISINSYRLDQYKGDLHKAVFDLSDPTLDRKMGPCTTCQYNTACLKLFTDSEQSPRCMNVSCFKHKSDIYFDREIKKVKEDPAVIFVNESSGEDGFIQKLKKDGFPVLRQYSDYSSINEPEKPDWEEFKDDYGDDETPEHELKNRFEKELRDYEKEFGEYQKRVSTGKYKKAFIVDGYRDKGKYIYIELKKKKANASAKAAVESGTADVSDVDQEISRIRERDKRNKEIDQEKIYTRIKELLSKAKDYSKSVEKLTQSELEAAALAIIDASTFNLKNSLSKLTGFSNSHDSKKIFASVKGITELGLNQLLRLFITDRLITGLAGGPVDGKALAIGEIARHYYPKEVKQFELEQQEIAGRRADRVSKRLSQLQLTKKELEKPKAASPVKDSKSKKEKVK